MERVTGILNHSLFQSYVKANEDAEADRIFCRHNMAHFLDVARVGRIIALEEDYPADMELFYAAALLHDVGKHVQYENGTPHEVASAELAERILQECGFTAVEIADIVDAILNHRNKDISEEKTMKGLLYRADKLSRACCACPARDECNWPDEKKNLRVVY